jgi:uncharacterized membrane protein YgdD (TMEM256/DUF423 family)
MPPDRLLGLVGALSAAAAVLAGAFGAHALRHRLDPQALGTFETAARYQMYHALATVGAALVAGKTGAGLAAWAGWLFVAGSVIFSGSLYLLALTGARWMGAVTPIGGACFVLGWIVLAVAFAIGR